MKKTASLIGAGVLMLATGQAMAQISPADRTFATKAAAGGEAEVVLGRLATEKAGSEQVRQYGQQMVTDHSQANQELQAIAKQQNLTLPTRPDAASAATEQRLQSSSGSAFDSAYARDMVRGPSAGCCGLPEGGKFWTGSRAEGVRAEIPAGAAAPSADGPADQRRTVRVRAPGMVDRGGKAGVQASPPVSSSTLVAHDRRWHIMS